MVGKGSDPKSSRIFHQCYLRCCKLQNLTPLTYVIPSGNGKVLNFCVDRIKYADWPAILNALSCDMSLHTVCIKCRHQVKTVLEHIDCERLAKTVNNRCVMLTNFMLSNFMEAIAQLLGNNTLLTSLSLEGLPLRIPYLNPLCEALVESNCLQHLHLPRCLIGDAGCLAISKSIRHLPNIQTLDLSGCELTPVGAQYIADLLKYQKIHRYSENWIQTLRYRLPDLDTMGGLRRITLCGNPLLGDEGLKKFVDVLADDLWIKALDVQDCGISEDGATGVLKMMESNTTIVVLDLRNNMDVSHDTLSRIRMALKSHERAMAAEFSWLASTSSESSSERLVKPVSIKSAVAKERALSSVRNVPVRNTNACAAKKEKAYATLLEEQLREEISHRQQLEELNIQLVEQMKHLQQQQVKLWASDNGSEPSVKSFPSGDLSNYSSSTSSVASVTIDQNTLSYIEQAFKDIYTFIRTNQCHGICVHQSSVQDKTNLPELPEIPQEPREPQESQERVEIREELTEMTSYNSEVRVNMIPKKAQSTHQKIDSGAARNKKETKSAHLLGNGQLRDRPEVKPVMFERHMGDSRNSHSGDFRTLESMVAVQKEKKKASIDESPCSSVSSDTLCSPLLTQRPQCAPPINPREAFYSSSESDDEGTP